MEEMRGTQCVLFAAVAGGAALRQKIGDAEAKHAVERCLKRIERATEAHRGRLVKAVGDEAMAMFATLEDGFHAACEMQQKIEALPPVTGIMLAVRIGFSFGEVCEGNDGISGSAANAAVHLLALACPGQAITDHDTVELLPKLLRTRMRQPDAVAIKDNAAAKELWELQWRGDEPRPLQPSHFAPTRQMEFRLRLRHGEEELFVGKQRIAVTLGRDKRCDLVIGDVRASRSHARIELRGNKFVLTDQSRNGTFIRTAANGSYTVRRREEILKGRGRLSFGKPYKEGAQDFVEYVVIE